MLVIGECTDEQSRRCYFSPAEIPVPGEAARFHAEGREVSIPGVLI